jgi:lactoylglutathione lyase
MKMAHVTIMTKCLNESVAFYQEQVGLTIKRDMRANKSHPIVFLQDKEGETCVELVGQNNPCYYGGGLSIGFLCEDINAEFAKKEEAGLKPGTIISPNPHASFFFVSDPNGVQIQFIQEG